MRLIIDQQPAANDSWNYLASENGVTPDFSALSEDSDLLVDWCCWQQCRDQLLSRSGRIGVKINGAVEVQALASDLDKLALIAVDFPSFADGRGFSQARLLKDSYGFSGELRAVGDVTWDRLRFMHRCGFNAYEIADERYSEKMLAAFDEITVRLQGSSDDSRPIYRQ
ncbi:MAG: DUF934 domain-containing protein [Motiliproteus sp.]